MWKRYLVEFGTGADLHGMDVTEAASKAGWWRLSD